MPAFIFDNVLHPLDTATSIHHTLNQVVILLATGSLSPREADTYLRLCRALLKNYKEARSEFKAPYLLEHKPAGEKFLAEVRESLVPAILADDRAAAAANHPAPPPPSAEYVVLKPPTLNLEPPLPAEPTTPYREFLVAAAAAAQAADPDRPLTVDAYIAKYLTAPLSPPALSLPNPPDLPPDTEQPRARPADHARKRELQPT